MRAKEHATVLSLALRTRAIKGWQAIRRDLRHALKRSEAHAFDFVGMFQSLTRPLGMGACLSNHISVPRQCACSSWQQMRNACLWRMVVHGQSLVPQGILTVPPHRVPQFPPATTSPPLVH
eukprot:6435900-Pyramimonas_sp.AAC.1